MCTALGGVSANALDGVGSLLDKSLLQRVEQEGDEPRLRLLETVREFGLECLAASGEMEVTQQAHATYYLSLLEKAWQNSLRADLWRWHARLEQEYDNLRAALYWHRSCRTPPLLACPQSPWASRWPRCRRST